MRHDGRLKKKGLAGSALGVDTKSLNRRPEASDPAPISHAPKCSIYGTPIVSAISEVS